MIKALSRLAIPAGILLAVLSCVVGQQPQQPDIIESRGEDRDPPVIDRREPKQTDPKKQEDCARRSRSGECEGDEDCEEICNDIFSSRADRNDCYELPEDLVSDFKELLEATEDGDTDEIDPGVLHCLLNIDEREFAKAIKKMSRRETENFLVDIVDDDHLAEVLDEEDDEFNILEQLLYKASGSNDLIPQLENEIDDGKSFFYLAAESSEFGWKWLDSYARDVCETPKPFCSEGESIQAYCQVLGKYNKRDLDEFLTETDLFAEEYQEEVEDDNYLYEWEDNHGERYKGDFRDWCKNENTPGAVPSGGSGGSGGSGRITTTDICPSGTESPDDSYKIAVITLGQLPKGCRETPDQCNPDSDPPILDTYEDFHRNSAPFWGYVKRGGYCAGTGKFRSPRGVGGQEKDSDILLAIDNVSEMYLNGDIFEKESDTKYYLWVRRNKGTVDYYRLIVKNPYTTNCSALLRPRKVFYFGREEGLPRRKTDMFGSSINSTDKYTIWLAKEKDSRCTFYTR